MAVDEFLYNIDSHADYNEKRRPSMLFVNPLPRQHSKGTPRFDDNLPSIDQRFRYSKNTEFLLPKEDNAWQGKLPRITVSMLQSSLEAEEYETEFGEPAKRALPAYYYEASQTVRQRTFRERRSDSARILVANKKRRLPSARTSPALMTHRAFAHASNNVPVYFPQHESRDISQVCLVNEAGDNETNSRCNRRPIYNIAYYRSENTNRT